MKKILRKGFGGFLGALLLAAELAVLADWIAVGYGHPLPRLPWLIGAGVLFLLLALLPFRRHKLSDTARHVLILSLVLLLGSQGLLLYLRRSGGYTVLDTGKGELYSGHRVLVTVPEPGQEIPLAAGVIEQYLRYGSELSLLFTGEADQEKATAEALFYGLPADRVLTADGEAGEALLRRFLEEQQPDIVLAAGSEIGMEVPNLTALLRELKKTLPDYQPLVLQGYVQALGLQAPADFHSSVNLLSTQEPVRQPKGANWEKRVRLPVDAGTLSHTMIGNSYETRLSWDAAERVINADRVFWQLGSADTELSFAKISDSQGNFLYDYYIDPLGKESLTLYTVGEADQPYSVNLEGDKCSAKIGLDRTLDVICPKGRSCIVTVTSADGKYWDTVLISNPGRFQRETAQTLERELHLFWEELLPASNSGQLFAAGWAWLQEKLPTRG